MVFIYSSEIEAIFRRWSVEEWKKKKSFRTGYKISPAALMLKQTEAEKREERIGFHFRGGERNIARNTLFVETVRRMFGGKVIVTSAYLKTIFFAFFTEGRSIIKLGFFTSCSVISGVKISCARKGC